ncbi:cupin domain-containing protein [Gordonia aurantiaca]|uniref:cupin domain-containing protein n=1 Tax=Gordonia sp. B21 TaxID=3151852 RepID=UPI00326678E0
MHQFQCVPTAQRDAVYTELLRTPAMSVGTYVVPAGADDPQRPHTEDEVYVVLGGRGLLRTEHGDDVAEPGVALFVPAGERHRFVEVTETLSMYVVFAPAEGTRSFPASGEER